MRINSITLPEKESDRLGELLHYRNRGKSTDDKITFQELAEELLVDAINVQFYAQTMKSIRP